MVRRSIFSLVLMLVFCSLGFVQARQSTGKHEFLYQDSLTVYLFDADTGTQTKLIEKIPGDFSQWLLSPNGKYLIKYSDPLVVYDIDARAWVEGISLPTNGYAGVAWSPDSTKIAYGIYVNKPGNLVNWGQLWIFDFETMKSRLLYDTKQPSNDEEAYEEHDQFVNVLSWTPDGKRLFFVEYYWIMGGTINWLETISLDGKGPSNFSSGGFSASFEIIWSPDGKSMLFNKHGDDFSDLILVDAANNRYLLTDTPDTWERNPRWSPDGKTIQFDTFEQTMSIDFQSVLRDPKSIKTLSISRLSYLAFPSSDNQFVAYLDLGKSDKGFDVYDLFVARVDRSNSIKVSELIVENDFIGWRPS